MAMPVKHYEQPGSPAWNARRARCWNAGDAPAMLGCSTNKTRTQLLQEIHSGLQREFSDFVQERVIDPGHEFEAWARPLAEQIMGDDLAVFAVTLDVPGLSRPLGASLDGGDGMDDAVWEHKRLNDALRAALPHAGRDSHERNDASQLPKMYRVQCEQQLLCLGASRALFSATDWKPNGELLEERHCWYRSDPALRAEILAGWPQFEKDLAAYKPTEIKERPAAEVSIALPALVIHAKGEITTSNMKEYGDALAKRLAEVRAIALVTDQDFSNAKESAKLLRENIQQAKLAKEQMLAQTVTVGEAARLIDTWCEDMRLTALKLEQDVEREDRAKKAAMVAKARSDYERHVEAAKVETGGPWIVLPTPDWAGALKSKRSYTSMQDALDTMLANAKIVADESARKIRAALAALDEESKGFEHLFADRLSFISKAAEDVRALARARVTEHRAAEERRAAELAERERARIRAEEEARAQRRAKVQERIYAIGTSGAPLDGRSSEELARIMRTLQTLTLTAEFLEDRVQDAVTARDKRLEEVDKARIAAVEREHAEQQRQADVHARARAEQEARDAEDRREQDHLAASLRKELSPAAGPAVIPMPTRAPAAAPAVPTLRLGVINERLGFTVTADFLASLGYPVVKQEGSAKLWHESSWHGICAAIAQHVVAVANGQKAVA